MGSTPTSADAAAAPQERAPQIGAEWAPDPAPYAQKQRYVQNVDPFAPVNHTPGRVHMTHWGPDYHAPLVLEGPGAAAPLTMGALVGDGGVQRAAPGAVRTFAVADDCAIRPLRPGERLRGVMLNRGGERSFIEGVSESAMISRLLEEAQRLTRSGYVVHKARMSRTPVDYVDVFVTDTDGPIYLVLQSRRAVLWHLHLADGVDLAHVQMVAAGPSGLLDPPPGVSFALARVKGGGAAGEPCPPVPTAAPDPTWGVAVNAREETGEITTWQNRLTTVRTAHGAYADWFRRAFGASYGDSTLSANMADAVLIGPRPTAPFAYRTAAERTAAMPEFDHWLRGDASARRTQRRDLHAAMIATAAGGEPWRIMPRDILRTGQAAQ